MPLICFIWKKKNHTIGVRFCIFCHLNLNLSDGCGGDGGGGGGGGGGGPPTLIFFSFPLSDSPPSNSSTYACRPENRKDEQKGE